MSKANSGILEYVLVPRLAHPVPPLPLYSMPWELPKGKKITVCAPIPASEECTQQISALAQEVVALDALGAAAMD